MKNDFSPDEINELRSKYRRRYLEELQNAVITVIQLENRGFNRESIIALFQTEDIKYWPKIFMRLKENKKFQHLMAQNAQIKLKQIEERISRLSALILSLKGTTYLEKFFKLFDRKSAGLAKMYEEQKAVLEDEKRFLKQLLT